MPAIVNSLIWCIAGAFKLIVKFHRYVFAKRLPLGIRQFWEMPCPLGIPLPIFGHSLSIKKQLHAQFQIWKEQSGDMFSCQMGSVKTVILSNPDLIKEAFDKEEFCGKPPLSVTSRIMNNKGIIHSEGELWKEQRRFATQCLRDLGFVPTRTNVRCVLEGHIEAQVEIFIEQVYVQGGEAYDYNGLIRSMVVNTICELLFNKVYESPDDKRLIDRQIELQEEGPKLVALSQKGNYFPILNYIPIINAGYKKLVANMEEHLRFLGERVEEQRAFIEANNLWKAPSNNFVDFYLKQMKIKKAAKKTDPSKKTDHFFTDQQLRHCLCDLFGAGTGTIISNIRYGMLYLASNEAVQDKAFEILQSTVGPNRDPNFTDIEKLPYIKAIVSEVQRMASIVPHGTPHGTIKEETLHGFHIPRKTMIINFFWGINHSNEYFLDHERFIPERFISKDCGDYVEPHGFIPFSAGGRNCIGAPFARMVMHLAFANILHNFKISHPVGGVPDFTTDEGFIFSPRPYQICLIPRHGLIDLPILPDVALINVLKYLAYEEISNNRLVNSYWNLLCKNELVKGYKFITYANRKWMINSFDSWSYDHPLLSMGTILQNAIVNLNTAYQNGGLFNNFPAGRVLDLASKAHRLLASVPVDPAHFQPGSIDPRPIIDAVQITEMAAIGAQDQFELNLAIDAASAFIESNVTKINFVDLPFDVNYKIFEYLQIGDICNIRSVCRSFKTIALHLINLKIKELRNNVRVKMISLNNTFPNSEREEMLNEKKKERLNLIMRFLHIIYFVVNWPKLDTTYTFNLRIILTDIERYIKENLFDQERPLLESFILFLAVFPNHCTNY